MASMANSDKQNDTSVFRAEDIIPPYNKKAHSISGAVQGANEIPKFDLAEQIMAEQRKITAIKRKAPGKKQKLRPNSPRHSQSAILLSNRRWRYQNRSKSLRRL